MNYINIKDLEIFAYHGVLEAEKELGQKFIVNAKLGFNTQFAYFSDDVKDTIHYGHVSKDIIHAVQENKYNLIETCADSIVEILFKKYDKLETIAIELVKPWAPIHKHVSAVSVEVNYSKKRVIIGMGSNIGNKEEHLNNAISAIQSLPLSKFITETSRITTKPYGNIEQEDFLNSVVEIETMLTADVLLAKLNQIELDNKRERTIKWGPRTLDLDILLYGNLVINRPNLVVPHPEITKRLFVLQSLIELNENLINPLTNLKYKDVYDDLLLEDK